MKNTKLFSPAFAIFLLLFAVSCKDDDKVIPTDCTGIHWTYEGAEGPEYWSELCTGYSDCSGPSQSPVDIHNAALDATLSAISKSYTTSKTDILNNGHTIQFNYDAGSSIIVNGDQYDLLQFHFHTSSEHTVNGSSHPMEVHLVHKNATSGKLAVIGIFFEEGAENALLNKFIGHLPEHHDETYTSAEEYAVADLLPAGEGYFTYPGSLTTPPCSETVTWIVMKDHIEASSDQIHEIESLEHENNRPVQSIGTRTIKEFGG